ncbi:MAG: 1,4-dihydroxy-2-naphthoate polyprenyltransferase [Bacillota bacterium]|nr:1,4-dihydroxy-2-naphthoate polyprenyltransferase [Bacillota bacterium]
MGAAAGAIKGLGLLLRLPAVLAWSGGGLYLAAGLAAKRGVAPERWLDLTLLGLGTLLLHGVVTHALNDRTDWASGTDRLSPGLLSGGSRVIRYGLLSPRALVRVSAAATLLTLALAGILLSRLGPGVLVALAVGLWSALAYSLPPLALAYRPLAGEWLGAFPALLSCTLGAYWTLRGTLEPPLGAAALGYGLLCQAWLAEHHLADVEADLAARPPKFTTAAWVSRRCGRAAGRIVPALYAGLALPFVASSAPGPPLVRPALAVPALLASTCAWCAPPDDVRATTRAELAMMALALLEAGLLVHLG